MASSRRSSASQLGGSWVVNDADSSDASLEEEAPIQYSPIRKPMKPKASEKRDVPTPLRSPTSRRRSSRASPAAPEPELIMPSLHDDSVGGSWFAGASSNMDISQRRQRSSKANTPKDAEVKRGNDKIAPSLRLSGPKTLGQLNNPDVMANLIDLLGNVAEWLLDVLGGALKFLKKPVSWVIAIYVFAGLLTLVQNLLTRSVYSALSPICRIPGSSFLHLPMCQTSTPKLRREDPTPAIEFDQLMTVQSRFEDVLEQSAAGVSLPLDMKRGETSIRDLRHIVRFSQLSSRNELVLEFDGFIETARVASYDLQKFNSHVGRGVDNVLATARWTQRVLDDMALKQSSRGVIPSFINNKILAPFQPVQLTESKLLDQYIQHTRIVSGEIEALVIEAQALLGVLQNLEDRLEVIHGIAYRDDMHAQLSKDEILSQLWTLLGGNRAALGKYNKQLGLLRQVGEYRKTAWAHVSGTILKLQAMGAELEELRERVDSAEVLRHRADIPLAVHLESIRLGVERLERGREAARELEKHHLERVLGRGDEPETRLLVEG
jgi:hypothetical protein